MRDRSTHKTVYSAKYHLIWCPRYRRRVLVGGVDTRLVSAVGGAPAGAVRRCVEDQRAGSGR